MQRRIAALVFQALLQRLARLRTCRARELSTALRAAAALDCRHDDLLDAVWAGMEQHPEAFQVRDMATF